MGLKMRFPQMEKQNPEVAAITLYREILKIRLWLESQTYNSENLKKARKQILLLLETYYRNCGGWDSSRLVQLADRVSYKVLDIVNFNPEDWDIRRRGEQFGQLEERLLEFGKEQRRSRQTPKLPVNVVPFRP